VCFECSERIIPDGSFWVLEHVPTGGGKKYVQLDLEKRFRMINWKRLFGAAEEAAPGGSLVDEAGRTEMLEKLFSANKGMSKLTGQEPESIDEMRSNEDLVKMLGRRLFPEPEVTEDKLDE
jgi:hypothetical protein